MAGADHDMQIEILKRCTVVRIFGYDRAGRRTSATYSGVTTSYAYDYESRITSITRTGVTTNSFAYNGLDTRVRKTDSAGTTSYERAGAYVTDSLLKSTVSSTTTDYTPGVSSRVGSDSTFLHSGIKNADTQTDDGGDVSAMRRTDAFGNPLAAWGGWWGPFGYGGPYGYQTDPDHGLMLLGHRYYEADTGRFLTRDPIKDGRNWYGHCGNNGIDSSDPDGLKLLLIGERSKTMKIKLEKALQQIGNTKRGKPIVNELLNGKTEYKLIVVGPGSGTITDVKQRTTIVTMDDINGLYQFMGKDGKYHSFDLLQVLSHELGHLVLGITGPKNEQRVVDTVENLINKDLKRPLRGKYEAVRRKPKVEGSR
jgi:RHS repeat-associated protein